MIRRSCLYLVLLVGALLIGGLFMAACSGPVDAETTAPERTPVVEAEAEVPATFEEVFAEYQALNARLDRVSYRLRAANTELCPVTVQDIGFSVHTVADYPDNIRPVARALVGAGADLSVRTVRPNGPADLSGVKPGDGVVSVAGVRLPSGPTAKTLYTALRNSRFDTPEIALTYRRDEALSEVLLVPETLCAYPALVFFSGDVNGHTDGRDVWITSGLLRAMPDDDDLALIVAHEMVHAVSGHFEQVPTKALELEADRQALVLMARAGYNVTDVAARWDAVPHPHDHESSATHPSLKERRKNLVAAAERITRAQAAGDLINLETVRP